MIPPPPGWLDRILAAVQTVPARTGSVITTVYGDAVLPRGGALALADLLVLMARLGASEGMVRTSVSRLASDGVLEGRRHGRRSAYALTASARDAFQAAVPAIYGPGRTAWDGTLRLAFPRHAEARAAMEQAGLRPLPASAGGTSGVMIALDPVGPDFAAEVVEAAGPPAALAALAARAWPLDDLAARYAAFLDVFGAVSVPPGIDALDAMAARIALVHAWRRIALRDPRLPPPLLPPGWPGHEARRVCVALAAELTPASERWLDQAGSGTGPLPPGLAPGLRWDA